MSDNELLNWIRLLNKNRFQDSIFLQRISIDVYFGFVWDNRSDKFQSMDNKHEVYFIKEGEIFVSCVYYGGSDIHIFTLPKFRRKGLMQKSLKNVILPHLLDHFNKHEQRATTNNPHSHSLLKKIGFLEFENYLTIAKQNLPEFIYPNSLEPLNELTLERAKILRKRLEQAFVEIAKVRDELTISSFENSKLTEIVSKNICTHCIPTDMFEEISNFNR